MNTFGRIKARNAIEDSSRNPGRPFAHGRRVTRALPPDLDGTSAPFIPFAAIVLPGAGTRVGRA
ncbi:hypothetical protein ACFWP2_15060 [Kitasatospora sp. NPDC058444]|uniref:hypothetical protein n=1 Tax=Kitasatospora sp. NPDC058444 TaxID=3346504 RepID=UPI003660DE5E